MNTNGQSISEAYGFGVGRIPGGTLVVSHYTCPHGIQSSIPFGHDPMAYGPTGKADYCHSRPIRPAQWANR